MVFTRAIDQPLESLIQIPDWPGHELGVPVRRIGVKFKIERGAPYFESPALTRSFVVRPRDSNPKPAD